ncbi:MAG: biotin--[acetyl-CoA-carboxylase] ligase [Bacteroidia bacterium]|nr:biotin--[acetyl-CoA-carboxylase] ligase [Bacteroidia bacterium]MDW8159638.1 biotin--[acetyl-CoA-carboxylase] ligase [Bacteroidia bacterium]
MLNLTTLFIGKTHIHLEEIDSTNNYARQYIPKGPEGLLITAAYQSQGRGQKSNTWLAERGKNILATLLLYPSFLKASQSFYLNIISSLAIQKGLTFATTHSIPFFIKWPNDIYAYSQKIAGILIETHIQGYFLENAIIGLGVNINQQNFTALPNATSLFRLTNKIWDISTILSKILEHFEYFYLQLKNHQFQELLTQYNQQLLFKNEIKKFHRMSTPESNYLFEGKIIGVTTQGKLMVQDFYGNIINFLPHEVQLVL